MSTLILVGASVRAAAMSARRAGFTPWCVDLFCDSDLRQLTRNAFRCPPGEWPQGVLPIFKDAPQAPWIYTGGLENHPNLIRELSDLRPLWGNGPNELLKSRSPFHVWKLLHDADLPCVEVRDADAELPDYCKWLRKPLKGCGGSEIGFVDTPLPEAEAGERKVYHQQFVEGVPYSSVYLGDGFDEARLIGSTRQLIGEAWLNAIPFQYCGNIGPVEPPAEVQLLLRQMGKVLVEGCKLKGLFGVDWILSEGQPWLIEVNPRYPASLEILELALGQRFLQDHARTFGAEMAQLPSMGTISGVVGKAVYYAKKEFAMPVNRGLRPLSLEHLVSFPAHADIPLSGEFMPAGWPVLSLFATATTVTQCRLKLENFADEFHFDLLTRLEART